MNYFSIREYNNIFLYICCREVLLWWNYWIQNGRLKLFIYSVLVTNPLLDRPFRNKSSHDIQEHFSNGWNFGMCLFRIRQCFYPPSLTVLRWCTHRCLPCIMKLMFTDFVFSMVSYNDVNVYILCFFHVKL